MLLWQHWVSDCHCQCQNSSFITSFINLLLRSCSFKFYLLFIHFVVFGSKVLLISQQNVFYAFKSYFVILNSFRVWTWSPWKWEKSVVFYLNGPCAVFATGALLGPCFEKFVQSLDLGAAVRARCDVLETFCPSMMSTEKASPQTMDSSFVGEWLRGDGGTGSAAAPRWMLAVSYQFGASLCTLADKVARLSSRSCRRLSSGALIRCLAFHSSLCFTHLISLLAIVSTTPKYY